MNLPAGTITFLFTDIEGSTRLWERSPDAMRLALARHDLLLRGAIEKYDGYVFKTVGDAFCAAFATAPQALQAALEVHLTLLQEQWGELGPIRVRVGLHTGEAEERDKDYFGQTLNRVARLQGVGHGQQTLLSQATFELVCEHLPRGVTLRDMGRHRLKDLAAPEHVFQLLHPELPSEFPPLKSLDYLPTNLPAQATSFIGREKEMEQVRQLLRTTRLLTLTGSGGTGKTRLSLQVAAMMLDHYPDGVWLVELAPLADPMLVAQTVADVLGVRETPGEPITNTLVSALKDKQLLLLLDNCEHVLDAAAHLIDTLLKFCPGLHLLASSREAFGIAGESAYRVPSLQLPDLKQPQTPPLLLCYESVRLFLERAVTAKADFALTDQNASALASVCYRLDGIPLAIELAAARVRAMPVEQIDVRLDNRFRLLTGGSRTALPRQQTLRALIDWSYDLLEESQKALLCRLSVFSGGWRLEAPEVVCVSESIEDWEILDLLTSLTDKSLVVYEERDGQAWYRLLETVRQYARERLAETGATEEVRERHRDWFLALAEEAESKLMGSEQSEWLQRLDQEHENLRTALEWSLLAPEASASLRLCGALSRFWWTRGYLSEGQEWCVRALAQADTLGPTTARAKALNGVGVLTLMQGDYATSRAYHEESLALFRELEDKSGIASALNNLGRVFSDLKDSDSARLCYEESLALFREQGERRGIANLLINLGILATNQGEYTVARAYQEESLTIRRELGDQGGIASPLNNLGILACIQGDYTAALAYFEESLAIKREMGDRRGIANSLVNLGNLTRDLEDYATARGYFAESLTLFREVGDRGGVAYALNGLGNVICLQGDAAAAWGYLEEGLTLRRELGDLSGVASSLEYLGRAALQRGEYTKARALHQECLEIQQQLGDQRGVMKSLENLALVPGAEGGDDQDDDRGGEEKAVEAV